MEGVMSISLFWWFFFPEYLSYSYDFLIFAQLFSVGLYCLLPKAFRIADVFILIVKVKGSIGKNERVWLLGS